MKSLFLLPLLFLAGCDKRYVAHFTDGSSYGFTAADCRIVDLEINCWNLGGIGIFNWKLEGIQEIVSVDGKDLVFRRNKS